MARGVTPGIRYTETHSALNWRLIVLGLVLPSSLEVIAIVLAIAVNPAWFVVAGFLPVFVPVLIPITLLYRNWPTGIHCADEGLMIGAIGSPRTASNRRPTVNHQSWGLFSVGWEAVNSLAVVTGRDELRRLSQPPAFGTQNTRWGKRATQTRCMIGVLSAPFMRGALTIAVDLTQAQLPAIRPAGFFPNRLDRPWQVSLKPEPSWTWVVPTRHPEELRRLIAELEIGQRGA